MIKSFIELFKAHKLQITIVFFAAIALYFNSTYNDYALDDEMVIYKNQFVIKGVDGIGDILTTDAFEGFFGKRGSKLISGGRYRPLSLITFALEWEFFGKNPQISHFINVFLFGFLSIGIYLFLTLLFDSKSAKKWYLTIPFLATLLYVFHPIHTEVVANIKGRDELLCFFFAILACITFIYSMKHPSNRNKILTAVLFFLALMSKENAITFLGVIGLIYYFKSEKILLKDGAIAMLPPIIATAIFLFIRNTYTQTGVKEVSSEILNNPFVWASSSEKWATIFYSFFKYLKLLILPTDLTHDYYYNQIPYKSFSDLGVILGIGICVAIGYFIIKNSSKRSSKVLFSLLFFVITFSIVSNVFFTVGIIMNERFVFVSSLGFAIICAFLFDKYFTESKKYIFFSILGIVLLGYGFKTIDRNRAWKNNLSLFSTDYTTSYGSSKVATSLGGVLIDEADKLESREEKNIILDSSIRVLNHAISIYPTRSQSWSLLATAVKKRYNDLEKHIPLYKHSINLTPGGFFDGAFNLGVEYYNSRQYDSALIYIRQATKISPNHKKAKELYVDVLAKLGRTTDALVNTGSDINSKANIALGAFNQNHFTQAMKLANEILAENPENPTANYVKGIILSKHQGQMSAGLPFLEKSIGYPETQTSWIENLAVAYGIVGRFKETIPLLEEVIKRSPNDPNPYKNLSTSYNMLGDKQKAQYYLQLYKSKK